MTPTIAYTIICDDVRIENNGKQILIGVYADGIILTHLPVVLRLVLWVEVRNIPSGITRLQFQALSNEDPTPLFKSDGELQSESAVDMAHLSIPMPVKFQSTGTLVIQMRASAEADWDTIKTVKVSMINPESVPT